MIIQFFFNVENPQLKNQNGYKTEYFETLRPTKRTSFYAKNREQDGIRRSFQLFGE